MFRRSGRLAAALTSGARKAGAAASLLILALSTSGCSIILERSKGIRFFEVLLRLWELLPEEVPTTPYEVFVEAAGEDYGQRYADYLQSLIQINLDVGLWSGIYDIAFILMGAFMGYFVVRYFQRVHYWIQQRGWQAVRSGGTPIVPPLPYIVKRLIPFVVGVVPMVLLVPLVLELVGETLSSMAFALYEGEGTTMESAIQEIFVRMLEGVQVWVFLLTFALNFVGGMIFLGFLAWRYITIPLYTALIYFHAPQYLNGEEPGKLAKPLERALHRVLVLLVTWFFIILGPLLVLELGTRGFPFAVAITLSMVLATVAPWILFGFRIFGREVYGGIPQTRSIAERVTAPVDTFTRTPGVGVTEEVHESFWKRARERLRPAADFAVEVGRRDPKYGPIITTTQAAYDKAKRMDAKTAGRDFGEAMYGDRPYRPQSPASSPSSGYATGSGATSPAAEGRTSARPALDRLISAALSSGLSAQKNALDDDVYAMSAWLFAIGYAGTVDQIVVHASEELETLPRQERMTLQEIGEQLKRHT